MGLTLGGLTVAGFYLIWKKLPRRVRNFAVRHPLATDLTAAIATYVVIGGSVTGLFAAAWTGIIVSLMLKVGNNPKLMVHVESFFKKVGDFWTKLGGELNSSSSPPQLSN